DRRGDEPPRPDRNGLARRDSKSTIFVDEVIEMSDRSRARLRWVGEVFVVCALAAAVIAVYCPLSVLTARRTLGGIDHSQLHMRRIVFAREQLFGENRSLPGWYPREFMGSPFWSNPQNFPFIPTRLLVFFTCRPDY